MSARSAFAILSTCTVALVVILWFAPGVPYSEASSISNSTQSFQQLSDRFEKLSEEKGAVYGFEVLRRAELPPQTDLHLLAHAIGDVLYRQEGVGGIAACTQDFRNACSHSIVIGALNEFGGERAIDLIRDSCKKAPGGSGAYTMCYHGLGHGVFAYFGYDIPKAVAFCAQASEGGIGGEYTECVGGITMELIGGGGHDRDLWLAARAKYFTSDPLSPCMDLVIPDEVKASCLTYLTPRLFEAAGANLADPSPTTFVKAFSFCERIPQTEVRLRDSCFGGFGKEFDVLVAARDIRRLAAGEYTDAELSRITLWCEMAGSADGVRSCVLSALGSLFWGGENEPETSFRYCELIPDTDMRNQCYKYLAHNIAIFTSGDRRIDLCSQLPENSRSTCTL